MLGSYICFKGLTTSYKTTASQVHQFFLIQCCNKFNIITRQLVPTPQFATTWNPKTVLVAFFNPDILAYSPG